MIITDTLKIALWESDRHLHALHMAQQDWSNIDFHGSIKDIEKNSELVRLTDQILFRFAKLQDAMGQRLIPATLAGLGESYEEWAMRDRLDRLEKLGFLETESWLKWREIRNRLAHEYPDDDALRLANLLAAIKASKELADNYRGWHTQLVLRKLL